MSVGREDGSSQDKSSVEAIATKTSQLSSQAFENVSMSGGQIVSSGPGGHHISAVDVYHETSNMLPSSSQFEDSDPLLSSSPMNRLVSATSRTILRAELTLQPEEQKQHSSILKDSTSRATGVASQLPRLARQLPLPPLAPKDPDTSDGEDSSDSATWAVPSDHKNRPLEADAILRRENTRKRSTKLWGNRLEEGTMQEYNGGPSMSVPESLTGARPTTFKWVRGELIGRGTYGRVYLALNATTGEMIAVKQVELPQTASDKNDSRQHAVAQTLKIEIEILKDLDHPHIVQYLGFEETAANLSIFLEYVPGGSVGSCLRKHGKFADNVTRSFTAQILNGLEYLHSRGILHRGLKADDILVEMSGICKIADFGISKRTEDPADDAFMAMQSTVYWVAPEVVKAQKGGYNFKIDIWSVGCVVLEMWQGSRPWTGEEMAAVMYKLHQGQAPPVLPDIILSEDAESFRKKCFVTNPEERPSSAELRKHPYLILPPDWDFTGFT